MKRFFLESPGMKVVSLLLATALWLVVRGERLTEMTVDVPLVTENLSPKFVVAGEIDPTINLRIVGPKTRLSRIDRATFPPYRLDLSNARKGPNSFWIHENDFKVPYGVRVTRIVPQVIRFSVEPAEEKLVRIEPRFVDEPDEGFEVERFEVIPAFTKKRGSRRELASTMFVHTEPVSLAGRHSSFSGEYALAGQQEGGGLEERRVTLKVLIREKEITKLFREIPVRVVGFRSAVKVEPRTVSIKATGAAGKVLALAEEHLEVEIDAIRYGIAGEKQKAIHVSPVLRQRPGLDLSVLPGTVRITLLAE
jgi:stage V sporulation protein SpoVS